MNRIALTVLSFTAASAAVWAQSQTGSHVRDLFKGLESGETASYSPVDFPHLTWNDIPALLEIGGSKTTLKAIPVNALSSYMQRSCTEGMAALWFVEGLRKGGRFGSLNPLIGPFKGGDWEKTSEAHHRQVLAAYRAWWNKVKDLSEDKAKKVDPLAGTSLHWH